MGGDTRIEGGSHHRTLLNVTKDGQACVDSSSYTKLAYNSEFHKSSYEFHPHSFKPLGSAGYIPVFYMENTSPNQNFHVEYVRFGWNGGDTNKDTVMSFRMYRNMTTPTTDVVEGKFGVSVGPHNMHLGAEIPPPAIIKFWDKAGADGMTIADVAMTTTELGDQINCGPLGKGSTFLNYHGALIFPPGMRFGIGLKGGETGSGICVLAGYFKKEDTV